MGQNSFVKAKPSNVLVKSRPLCLSEENEFEDELLSNKEEYNQIKQNKISDSNSMSSADADNH